MWQQPTMLNFELHTGLEVALVQATQNARHLSPSIIRKKQSSQNARHLSPSIIRKKRSLMTLRCWQVSQSKQPKEWADTPPPFRDKGKFPLQLTLGKNLIKWTTCPMTTLKGGKMFSFNHPYSSMWEI